MNHLTDGSLYAGIEEKGLTTDIRGWHSEAPVFARVIAETQPETIVEVGSWKGASAIHMARLTAPRHTRIVCVDTWLGGFSLMAGNGEPGRIPRDHGYPTIYFQFLHNVKAAGFEHRITPLPMTSRDGARFLSLADNRAELVYIDGSHLYDDVMDDLSDYWPLVAPGGILFGDDYPLDEVRHAVNRFCTIHIGAKYEVDGGHFIIRKPRI